MSTAVLDARKVRSREALRQAMFDLAAELPLDAITVRAIAARAGVGYATFFRHYADKEALLADVADMLTKSFLDRVRPLLLARDRRGAARSLCAFVEANLPIHKALIAGGSGDTVRTGMLRQTLETMTQARDAAGDGCAQPYDDLLMFHLVSAILNLLAWWLRNYESVDAELVAETIDRAVLGPVEAIRRAPGATSGLTPSA